MGNQNVVKNKKYRDYSIDIMRFIGLLGVILAHVGAPSELSVIREFDVTLMVFVMCGSYLLSNKNENYLKYVRKRFNRLVVTCWKFLFIYYTCFYVFSILFHQSFHYSVDDIFFTVYTFDKFGGTWVIRVYFIIALVLPFAKNIVKHIDSNKKEILFWIFIAVLYCVYYLLFKYYNDFAYENNVIRYMIYTYIIEAFGWALCVFTSVKIWLGNAKIKYYLVASCILFLMAGYVFGYTTMGNYKYPPQILYLSYGILISIILKIIFNIKIKNGEKIADIVCNKFSFIVWMSVNSMWVYLWHLLYLSLFRFVLERIPVIDTWYVLYIIVIGFSVLTTICVNKVNNLLNKY